MVAVEKYIRKLLYEQDCVIIPELGGLLTHHINAQFNSATGVFSPSQKRVAFNEVLKLDDGLLTYFISVNEKISREEALSNVKRYTEILRISLREEGKATIAGVGSFKTNTEGKLVFEPDSYQNFNVDWFGLQGVKAVELKSASAPVEKEVIQEVSDSPQLVASEEVFSQDRGDEGTSTRKIKWGWTGWAAAAVVAGMAFYMNIFSLPGATNSNVASSQASPAKHVSSSMLSTLNPVYGISEFIQTSIAELSAKESAAIVKPLVKREEVPSITAQSIESTPLSDVLPAEVPVTVVSTSASLNTVTIAEARKEASPSFAPAENTVKKFYIIAGSFESMKYANLLLYQLQQEGFSSAFIMEPKGRGLIKVSAIGFDTSREAYSNLDEVEKVAGKGVWVYKNRN